MNLVYLTPRKVTTTTTDLTSCEQLLLWSIRCWVMGYIRKTPVESDISRAYGTYDIPEAGAPLAHFMYALSFGARRTIDISCPLKGTLSPDELTLLNIFANIQAGKISFACCMLSNLCQESYLMQARFHALEFAALTRDKGHMKFTCLKLGDGQQNHLTHLPNPLPAQPAIFSLA